MKYLYFFQAFADRMDQPGIVSTRPRDYHDALASTSGVVFSNGHVWKENRKMFLSTLNRMGMGDKNKMDMIIEEEVADFCDILGEKVGGTEGKRVKVRECYYQQLFPTPTFAYDLDLSSFDKYSRLL